MSEAKPTYGFGKWKDIPVSEFEKAQIAVSEYCISFFLYHGPPAQGPEADANLIDPAFIGSGTLVCCGEKKGILTASHVARQFYLQGANIGLVFKRTGHNTILDRRFVERIEIGKFDGESERGPDLAFLQLLDVKTVAAIESVRSFYNIDIRTPKSVSAPLDSVPWWIAGFPKCLKMPGFTPGIGRHGDTTHNLIIPNAQFLAIEQRNGFDYVTLSLAFTEDSTLKHTTEGMSGGGVWIMPFSTNPDIHPVAIKAEAPVLVGVLFQEGNLIDNKRLMLCHGPDSVYRVVTDNL